MKIPSPAWGLKEKGVVIMSNNAGEIILTVGLAVALVIVSLAVADHINRAQTVELYTQNYAIRSNQYALIES